MALSFDEFRKRLLDTAQKNDEERAAITARVSETASQYEPVRTVSAKDQQDAQIASRLDQPISSHSVINQRNQQSAQIASRLDNSLMGQAINGGVRRLKDLRKQREEEERPRPGGASDQYAQLYQKMKGAYGDRVDEWLDAQERGSFTPGGGFGTNEENHAAERPWYQTAYDAIGRGAGQAVNLVTSTADFAANAIPRVEGAIFGVEPEGTFTGQLLKPLTDATGFTNDFVGNTTAALDEQIREDTKDSKVAQIATNLTSGVVSALPNAVLAFLSGGASAGGQLAAQGTGLSGTVSNAANQLLHNPMFQLSAAQTLGSSYDEAKEAGASDIEAMTAATVSALLNALVEVGGGIETLPGELQNVDLSTREKVFEWVKSALDEGKEEVIQGVISNLTNKATFDSDRPYFSTEDNSAVVNPLRMAQEFGSGAAIGGLLSGGQLVANSFANRAAKNIKVDDVMPKLNGDDGLPRRQSRLAMTEEDGSTAPRNDSTVGGEEAVARAVSDIVRNNDQLNIDNTEAGAYTESRSTGGANNGTELDGNSGTGVRGRPDGGTADSSMAGRVPPDGRGNLSDTGVVLLSPESQQILTERGIVNVELHDSSADNAAFSSALDAARAVDNQNGWAVTPKSPEKLAQSGAKSYMDQNGSTGFAIAPDGDIEAVFANKAAGAPKGSTKSTIPQAIALGGDKLDCYGHNLVDIYARYGFEPVARVRFDPEQANPGWTPDKGTPDIYFMMHNGDSADTVVQKMSNYKVWSKAELDALPVMEYDEAYEYRDALLNRRKGKPITVDDVMPRVGDMGAKTSDFPHEVKENKGKTLPDYYERNNVPEEGRADNHYTAVTEAESLHNAKLRLEQDYNGEVEELSNKADWNNEDMDMSYMVLDDLAAEARRTGDWDSFKQWAKLDQDRGGDAARALQSRAKRNRNSAVGILSTAAQALETAKDGVDTNAVMSTVADYADQYETASKARDVDELLQIIRDTSAARRTGTLRSKGQEFSKQMNWALARVAEYARAELKAAPTQVNTVPVSTKPVQNYSAKVGDRVRVLDRDNVGTIQSINTEAGTYTVHFKSPNSGEATKTFSGDMIAKIGHNKPIETSRNTVDVGRYYDFLQNFAANSIEAIATDTQKSSAGKKIMTIRRNAMLSKASTIFRNLVGNNLFDPVDSISNDIAVPLDMLLSKFTGTRSVAADLSWASEAKRKGSIDALAMAMLEVGLDVNAEGANSKYESGSNRTFHMSGGVASQLLSQWEKYMGYFLNVTDEFQKGGVEAEVQRGIDKLYEKGKISDDSLRDAGKQTALYRTFQDETALSNTAQDIRGALNNIHAGEVGLGDTVLPFAQVPSNLAARAMDYSPVGLVRGMGKLAKVLYSAKNGTLTAAQQRSAVQDIGRGINGTGLIAGFAALALKDLIKVEAPGGDDENANKAASDKAKNLSGTQLNVSAIARAIKGESTEWRKDDKLVSIGYLDPFNAMMTTGALIAEDIKNGDTSMMSVAQASLEGTVQSLLEMPVFQTFKDVSNAYQYSDADTNGGKIIDAAQQLAASEVASIIPNSLKGIAQGLDEYQRDLYTGDTWTERLGDQFKAVFDRDSLPIKQDVYGNDLKNEDRLQSFLNSNIRPGAVVQYTESDLQAALDRMHEETGGYSMYLSKNPPKTVTVGDESIALTDDQQRAYMTERGDVYEDVSAALEQNETYQSFSGGWQEKAYEIGKDYAQQTAKEELGIGYEPDIWVQELEGATQEELSETLVKKVVEAMAPKYSDSGKDKYEGLSNLVEDGTIEDTVAIACLPPSTLERWESYGEQYKVPVSTLMDVISYGNSDESKGEKNAKGKDIEGKSHQDKMRKYLNGIKGLSPAQKRGIWKIVVSDKGDCPW